jgi:hypothetical protein
MKKYLCLLVLLCGCQAQKTRELVEKEAQASLYDEDRAAKDAWGRPLEYTRLVEKEGIFVQVRSPGSDGKLNTDDDIFVSKQDLNKSYLIGKYVGNRAKEAKDGVLDGIKDSYFKNKSK